MTQLSVGPISSWLNKCWEKLEWRDWQVQNVSVIGPQQTQHTKRLKRHLVHIEEYTETMRTHPALINQSLGPKKEFKFPSIFLVNWCITTAFSKTTFSDSNDICHEHPFTKFVAKDIRGAIFHFFWNYYCMALRSTWRWWEIKLLFCGLFREKQKHTCRLMSLWKFHYLEAQRLRELIAKTNNSSSSKDDRLKTTFSANDNNNI